MKFIQHQQKIINYQIERKKIKHAYFRVKDGFIQVTANQFMSEEKIIHYMHSKFDLFYQKIEKRNHKAPSNTLNLWGKSYEIVLRTGRFHYEIVGDQIIIDRPVSKETTYVKDILKKEMEKVLPNMMKHIEPHMASEQIPICPIKLKYLKSKFGSYHRKKHEITLNTFLATQEPIYLIYVIYHEYAHAKVFNHSKAFYQVLDKWMPNHKSIQKDLKKLAII